MAQNQDALIQSTMTQNQDAFNQSTMTQNQDALNQTAIGYITRLNITAISQETSIFYIKTKVGIHLEGGKPELCNRKIWPKIGRVE